MNEDSYRGDDLISRPPAGVVLVQKIGSWDILFSDAEQSIYIVPIDYHPEPFRISLSDQGCSYCLLLQCFVTHACACPCSRDAGAF